MVQFSLPADSRINPGKKFNPATSGVTKKFHIYRYDPEKKENPRIDTYHVPPACFMILDALNYIKKHFDGSFAFRKSCCEGVCGSCSININGVNTLACITPVNSFKKDVVIYPLPHMQVIKDLVADIDPALKQYGDIKPWLRATSPSSVYKERIQSPENRHKLDGLWECILCFCCTASCPSYWWNGKNYLGPAVLLQARRWLADSRDEATDERLNMLDDAFRLYRCHTILNCVKACPKGLNPGKAIADIKRDLVKRHF